VTWEPVNDLIVGLIPAYEEGPRIGAVVEAARRHVPVVVVDDGSSDDTAERAEAAGATVLRQVPNAGKGAALRRGFGHALDAGAAAVVTLDADGQHDPAEIPAFLAAFERSRPELVIGARDFGEMPFIRRLSNVLGGLTLSAALGRSVPDNQSGY
jgi:glycosyltransferase involved in cell wall biosynthesis